MNILITGIGGPSGINTLAYAPRDATIFGCDADPGAVERIRKAGLKPPVFLKVPPARDRDFLPSINSIISKNEIDMVIPNVDEELLVFSKNPMEKVIVSPQETVNACNDKYVLYERFMEYGFCPVFALGGADTAIYGKVFVKPRTGRGSRNTASFPSNREVPRQFLTNEYVLCEYLPGKEYTVDAMCDLQGNLLYAVPRVRVEVIKGVSVRGRTEKNREIMRITGEICKVLKFVGPINLQFKLDAKGKPKLVEINPRFSGGLPITVAAGIKPLEILMDLVMGKTIGKDRLEWKETESDNEVMRRLRL